MIHRCEESSRLLCQVMCDNACLWPLQQIGLSQQFYSCCNSVIECSYLFAVYLSCLVTFLLLLSLNQTLAFQLQRLFYNKKHAFLTDCSTLLKYKSGILVECTGWNHRVKYKNGKCLQIGVMSCLINFCHVKLLSSIGLVLGVV